MRGGIAQAQFDPWSPLLSAMLDISASRCSFRPSSFTAPSAAPRARSVALYSLLTLLSIVRSIAISAVSFIGRSLRRPARSLIPITAKRQSLGGTAALTCRCVLVALRLIGISWFRTNLQPLQPAQQESNVLRQFFSGDVVRCLTQRGADAVDEVNVVDPRHVFGLLLHIGRLD